MSAVPHRDLLEGLYARHHHLENLHPDPLVFARRYRDPNDGELAGLIAAAFAYGRVEKIMEALERVFGVLGPSPRDRLLQLKPKDDALESLVGFKYRFHKKEDVALVFHLLRQVLERRGSLLRLFQSCDDGACTGPALAGFAEEILSGDARPLLRARTLPAGHPVRFLLSSPARGGAAKRLCLFLRWMVRRDEIDPGFWHGSVDPARLIVPLDTHVARVARQLGFTRRSAADWRTALEVTSSLRSYDPADPVRFDFSLFRFGMERAGRNISALSSEKGA